jgi:hypothetical protein
MPLLGLALRCAAVAAAAGAPLSSVPACANVTNRTQCGDRCQPLTLAEIRPRAFEVTAYHACGYGGAQGDEWKRFDWSKLTTVAQFCNRDEPGLICAAHEHGVRVVNWLDTVDRIAAGKATCAVNVTNSSSVGKYIADVLNETQSKGYDGILFDIEASCARAGKVLPNGTVPWSHMQALTSAVAKTADAMHAANPAALVMCECRACYPRNACLCSRLPAAAALNWPAQRMTASSCNAVQIRVRRTYATRRARPRVRRSTTTASTRPTSTLSSWRRILIPCSLWSTAQWTTGRRAVPRSAGSTPRFRATSRVASRSKGK